jgi:PAS domain-containing protein
VALGVLSSVIHRDVIDDAIRETGKREERSRLLPAHVVVYYVLALNLSFEVVAEAIPHMVWLADASGSAEYFNERGTEYAGLPRQANYGWEWVKLVHPHDAELARLG